jgi:hypothetical protein
MHTTQHHNSPSSNTNNMTSSNPIDKAISALESGECTSIAEAARKHDVHRSTLSRRYNEKTVSRQEAASIYSKTLTTNQELVLIEWIHGLSDRGLPPTPQMVKNEVERILKHNIGKCWVARFCERYSGTITSKYLKGIDKARHTAENEAHFDDYYQQVKYCQVALPSYRYSYLKITNYFNSLAKLLLNTAFLAISSTISMKKASL